VEGILHSLESKYLIAILVPLAGMVLAGFIVFLAFHYRHLRTEKLMETVQRLADRGLPVPPELLAPDESEKKSSPLFNAITLIGVGVGLALMFHFLNLRFLMGVGALLVCIGAAQLLALWIETRRAPSDDARPGAR
jgi:hypothetical protein